MLSIIKHRRDLTEYFINSFKDSRHGINRYHFLANIILDESCLCMDCKGCIGKRLAQPYQMTRGCK